MPLDDLSRLKDLERQKKISIGIHKSKANNYFYGTSILGKLLNWVTNICVVFFFAGMAADFFLFFFPPGGAILQ